MVSRSRGRSPGDWSLPAFCPAHLLLLLLPQVRCYPLLPLLLLAFVFLSARCSRSYSASFGPLLSRSVPSVKSPFASQVLEMQAVAFAMLECLPLVSRLCVCVRYLLKERGLMRRCGATLSHLLSGYGKVRKPTMRKHCRALASNKW